MQCIRQVSGFFQHISILEISSASSPNSAHAAFDLPQKWEVRVQNDVVLDDSAFELQSGKTHAHHHVRLLFEQASQRNVVYIFLLKMLNCIVNIIHFKKLLCLFVD